MKTFLFTAVVLLGFFVPGESVAVEIIAHRGASHDAPENTLASVKLAWKQKADAVEIDVFLSKDGRIVVTHDDTPKRFGGPDRKVASLTFAELRRIDVGTWKAKKWAGERMPELSEILATIPKGKRLFIEIKCGPEILPELKRALKSAGKSPGQTALIGFSYETMRAAKQEFPHLKVFWVVGLKQNKKTKAWRPALDTMIRKAKAAKLDGLDLSAKPPINRTYIDRVKQSGMGFYIWTVNSAAQAGRLKAAGVDGITTDRPGWLRERLRTTR